MTKNTGNQKEFAAFMGVFDSQVTKWKQAGSLVLVENSKLVIFDQSKAKIAENEDLSKVGVKARHAKERAEKNKEKSVETQDEPIGSKTKQKEETNAYWQRKINEEKFKAIERENQIAEGKLLVADNVTSAVFNAITILRNRFESQPDRLSAQLAAESDPNKCRAMIIDDNEIFLTEISQCFTKLVVQN